MNPNNPENKTIRNIRRLIWLYFWLLLIEGALRKWVAPSLSNPLLIIREVRTPGVPRSLVPGGEGRATIVGKVAPTGVH